MSKATGGLTYLHPFQNLLPNPRNSIPQIIPLWTSSYWISCLPLSLQNPKNGCLSILNPINLIYLPFLLAFHFLFSLAFVMGHHGLALAWKKLWKVSNLELMVYMAHHPSKKNLTWPSASKEGGGLLHFCRMVKIFTCKSFNQLSIVFLFKALIWWPFMLSSSQCFFLLKSKQLFPFTVSCILVLLICYWLLDFLVCCLETCLSTSTSRELWI